MEAEAVDLRQDLRQVRIHSQDWRRLQRSARPQEAGIGASKVPPRGRSGAAGDTQGQLIQTAVVSPKERLIYH